MNLLERFTLEGGPDLKVCLAAGCKATVVIGLVSAKSIPATRPALGFRSSARLLYFWPRTIELGIK